MTGRTGTLGDVVENARVNAGLSWLLVAFVALAAAESLLDGDLLWMGFTGSVAALAVVPAVAYRDPTVMLPWEVLALAALPVVGRALATVALTSRLATYLSVAALALIVAVELHTFTPVRMTDWFAVLFVVVATIATAGVWAVVQWLSDVFLGTALIQSEHRLMWGFVAATAAGLLSGVIFQLYFRRHVRVTARLPDEIGEGDR